MAHDASRSIAECGPAAVADMHRAGRISGYVFEVHIAHALRDLALAVVVLLHKHIGEHALVRRRRKAYVDEAGTCDLDRFDHVVLGKMVDDDLSDFSGVLFSLLRAAHSHRRSPVAVGFVARTLQSRRRRFFQFKSPFRQSVFQGIVHHEFKLFANLHDASFNRYLIPYSCS